VTKAFKVGLVYAAGTATVAPIKFTSTSATLLTTPTAGSMEVDSSGNLYYSPSTTRYTVPLSTTGNSLIFTTSGATTITLPTSGTMITSSSPTITTPTITTINGGNAANANLFNDQTTNGITIGSGLTTGTLNIDTASTGAHTVNIATGATAALTTKTINIGTSGIASSTTNINIGSAAGSQTTTTTISGATYYSFAGTNFLQIINPYLNMSQIKSPDTATTSVQSYNVYLYSGNATGTTSNSGSVYIDSGTATSTAGSITIGGYTAPTISIGTQTIANTLNIATGAGTTNKTINIGTASTAGTTAITIGSSSGATSTIQLNGAVTFSTAPVISTITNTGTITLPTATGTLALTSGVINNTLTTTTGDMIYASGANTPARLGIGSTGQVLTVSGGIPTWATATSGKNAIINGGMDIWQRGTSVAISASTAYQYTADRWCSTSTGASEAITVSRQATGDTTNLPNIQYALRYQRNSGQTGTTGLSLYQPLETTNSIPFAGKSVTLSFYARAGSNFSATSSLLGVYLSSSTGADQNPSSAWVGSASVISSNATLTTTWQRFTFTGTIATTATQLYPQFTFNPTGTAGANDYFDITGVQLELGSTATTFSRAGGSIGGELALCQRYCQSLNVLSPNGTSGAYLAMGAGVGPNSQVIFDIALKVTMRAVPSGLTFNNLQISDGYTGSTALSSFSILSYSNADMVSLSSAGTFTKGTVYWLATTSTSNAYVLWSAEL